MYGNRIHSWREKNIVFIGFMGVGKTTVGKLVAQKLNRSFIDIDDEIENQLNLSVPQIFERYGEAHFRSLERNVINETVLNNKLKIISLGGGAFLQEEIRELCLQNCIVFFLDLSWDEWIKRWETLQADRPVLKSKSLSDIKKLYNDRYPFYSLSNSSIEMKQSSPEELADYIVDCLKEGWELYDTEKRLDEFK